MPSHSNIQGPSDEGPRRSCCIASVKSGRCLRRVGCRGLTRPTGLSIPSLLPHSAFLYVRPFTTNSTRLEELLFPPHPTTVAPFIKFSFHVVRRPPLQKHFVSYTVLQRVTWRYTPRGSAYHNPVPHSQYCITHAFRVTSYRILIHSSLSTAIGGSRNKRNLPTLLAVPLPQLQALHYHTILDITYLPIVRLQCFFSHP